MPRITLNEISALQSATENIRNVCFLAHVDHGKTTLSDHLISWNGIISSKNAGNLRYLDSRPDEQERQITMKASSISLVYMPRKAKLPFLINLVDSPGHVDFSNEASTAVRLCDGALVLVDVLEGICVQTVSVLKQAWSECVRPILVLNKMDRLITELNMSAIEAYAHIDKLIGRVNALVSTFSTGQAFERIHANDDLEDDEQKESEDKPTKKKKKKKHKDKDKKKKRKEKKKVIDTSKYTVELDEESQWFFSPNKGNVVFCSAKHKWGFTINSVAQYYHKTKKMNRKVLVEHLWGNYYFYKNDIHKKPSKNHVLPMFVEFILEPIWSIYQNVYIDYRMDEFKRWIKKLKITIPPREIDNHKDTKTKMIALMSRWMSISNAVLDTIVKQLPSPKEAQKERLPKIWNLDHLPKPMVNALTDCDPNYKQCVVYIPKMIHVSNRQIEDALTEKHHQTVQRTEYQRGKYKELQQQKMEAIQLECKGIIDGIIENVVDPADPNDVEVVTDTIDKLEINGNDTMEEEAKKKNSLDDEQCKVKDVSNIWERFQEITYMESDDDEEEELPSRKVLDEIAILNGLFMGVGRVYCGTLSEESDIHIFGPRHHDGELDHAVIKGYKLFHLMGKDIGYMKQIPAGNICGIGGIHDYLQKTGFITTSLNVPMVQTISTMSFPVVRVAIEPKKYTDLQQLKTGLKLLNKCDTGAEILIQSNGEYVICASGELHLARCVRDLQDTFAKDIELEVSEPLVSFKETIVSVSGQELEDRKQYILKLNEQRKKEKEEDVDINGDKIDEDDYGDSDDEEDLEEIDCIESVFGKRYDHTKIDKEVVLDNKGMKLQFSVQAMPLKNKLIEFIQDNQDSIQDLVYFINHIHDEYIKVDHHILNKHKEFEQKLTEKLSSKMNINDIVAFGPHSIGCNILFIKDESMTKYCSLFHQLNQITINNTNDTEANIETKEDDSIKNLVQQAIKNGFQSVTNKGPLCQEPMYGVGFIIDNIQIVSDTDNNNHFDTKSDTTDTRLITTNIMSTIREGCIDSFLSCSPRLVQPMYKVFIQGTTEVLGSIYDVIQKRKGKITGDSIVEGTNLFDIYSLLPVIESFGFCDELRTETAGNVVPQLTFSHWSIINEDPLWIPMTHEEIEEYGNIAHKKNNISYKMDKYDYVKKLIENVRKRKGLKTNIQTVESAEKQSTRSRKK